MRYLRARRRKGLSLSIEELGKILLAVLFIAGLATIVMALTGELSWLFDSLFGNIGWHPYAIASAKAVCFATNSVYGDVESGGWVSANDINENCEKKPTASSITGMAASGVQMLGVGGGHIEVKCEEGLGRASGGEIGCHLRNFELPQLNKDEFSKILSGATFQKYAPGAGEPDYVVYYGKWPSTDASAAWSNWAAFNLITTVIPPAKLAKAGKAVAKPAVKIAGKGARVVPGLTTSAKAVRYTAKPVVKAGSTIKEPVSNLVRDFGAAVTRLGLEGMGRVDSSLRVWIAWATELGADKLAGQSVTAAADDTTFEAVRRFSGRSVENLGERVVEATGSGYRMSLRAFLYAANRNGVDIYNGQAARQMVDNLEDLGKVTGPQARRARTLIENDRVNLIRVLTKDEADRAMGFIDEAHTGKFDVKMAQEVEAYMGIGAADKGMVLLPKYFIIREGTTSIDEIIGQKPGAGDECVMTLKGKGDADHTKTFVMSHCQDNPDGLQTSPGRTDEDDSTYDPGTDGGVALLKFDSLNVPGGGTPADAVPIIGDFLGAQIVPEVKYRFYAASPCLSRTGGEMDSNGGDMVGPSSGDDNFMGVFPEDNQVQVALPLTRAGYSPNFCWWYPASNLVQWPGIDTLFNMLGKIPGVPVLEEFDLGLAPWPCHGVLVLADLNDQVYKHLGGLPVIGNGAADLLALGGVLGTCGGA